MYSLAEVLENCKLYWEKKFVKYFNCNRLINKNEFIRNDRDRPRDQRLKIIKLLY